MREECGVFGIYYYDQNVDCAQDIYYGLVALQHRGQEGCGIAVNRNRETMHYKDVGLVLDVFDEKNIRSLKGHMGVGHVRYSTAGGAERSNVQPLVLRYVKGSLSIAHNGNLTNAGALRKEYEKTGAIYQTTSDTEIVAYTIARERIKCKSVEDAVAKSMSILKGAYSLIVMSPEKLIAARDPWGFRPLCLGKIDGGYVFSSESCAFDAIGAEYVRDILPGEVVVVTKHGIRSFMAEIETESRLCIFEYIYFARPDSIIYGKSVDEARRQAGRFLAQEHPAEADIVIGVPDSGTPAATGFAQESGIPYGVGFIKNRYIGRTFIKPQQESREQAVKMKLNALRSSINGKRVVMVDDSIVRGTTVKYIVKLLRDAGAREVHVRISSPPFLWPCYYGTDIPSKDALVACHHSVDEIKEMINADSLGYMSMKNTLKIAEGAPTNFCDACFTGNYPV